MNTLHVEVRVKDELNPIRLVLYQKIYSTPNGIVNCWSTNNASKYRLQVLIDESDLSVNPSKVSKDMQILTDEGDIAGQILVKFHEKRILELQNN